MKRLITLSTGLLLGAVAAGSALAKLPAPVLTDEAKAKAAEAAAKTAHGNKVADYQLCKSMDRVGAALPGRGEEGRQGRQATDGHAALCRPGCVRLSAARGWGRAGRRARRRRGASRQSPCQEELRARAVITAASARRARPRTDPPHVAAPA